MCRCTAQQNALYPRVEISAIAVVMLALAWLKKKNNNQKEDGQSGVFMSWRLTTSAKLSVDISDAVSFTLSKEGLQ